MTQTKSQLLGPVKNIVSDNLTLQGASNTSSRVSSHGFICRDNWGSQTGMGNGMFSPAANTLAFTTNSVERLRIDSGGNVLFAGSVKGGYFYTGDLANGPYTYLTGQGTLDLSPNSDTTGLTIQRPLGTIAVNLKADGSATFKGEHRVELSANSSQNYFAYNTGSSGYLFRGQNSGGDTVFITPTGAATFLGKIEAGTASTAYGVEANSGSATSTYASVSARNFVTGGNVWQGKNASSGTQTSKITESGDAFFGWSSVGLVSGTGVSISKGGTSWFSAINDYPMGINRITSDGNLVTFTRAGTTVGWISVLGGLMTYGGTSDYRLKENITAITSGIDRLKQLKPCRFNFKAYTGRTIDGFIAHEVSSVVPEAIIGEKDAMRDEEYEVTPAVEASEGVDAVPAVMGTRSVPDYQGIDQSKLIPLLTAALQEAITKIETLEAKVTALESN